MLTDIMQFRAAFVDGERKNAARQPVFTTGARDYVTIAINTSAK